MARHLRKLHYSPLMTNAACNRQIAMKAFAAGLSVADIAAEWPEVFRMDRDGKLSQIYDSEIADGSGRLETRYRITADSLKLALAKKH